MKYSLCHAFYKNGASLMKHKFRRSQKLAVWLLLMVFSFSGCTLKATLDTTSDGVTNFLSSTTGKSWWTEDGLVKNGEHARAFVATNYDNLLQEIAKGEGEYLQAFGTVLGVPAHQQAPFQRLVQARYPTLAEIPIFQGEDQLNSFIGQVQQAWDRSHSKNL